MVGGGKTDICSVQSALVTAQVCQRCKIYGPFVQLPCGLIDFFPWDTLCVHLVTYFTVNVFPYGATYY